jgi:hypothetical protein
VILLNVVNTTGQYVLNRLVVDEAAARFGTGDDAIAASRPFITALSGSLTAAVNLLGLPFPRWAIPAGSRGSCSSTEMNAASDVQAVAKSYTAN